MKKIINILTHDIWFHIFSITSLGLIIASFIIPPLGIIDSSVFAGVGELFGFAALWEVHIAIKKGLGTRVTHHDTTIEINKNDEK